MGKGKSSFDRVHEHLLARGSNTPFPEEMQEHLVMVLRRVERADDICREEYPPVELSPYMESLLRVTAADRTAAPSREQLVASL